MTPQPGKPTTIIQLNTQATAHGTTPAPPNADNTTLLVIGADETPIFVPKSHLTTIPFFDRIFSSPFPFQETIDNKVTLPEDDAGLWRRALEYLRTGAFHPRFTAREPGDTTPRRLDVALLVLDDDGEMVTWVSSALDRFGTEFLSDGTRGMLEEILLLFCLAEKYLWADLMDECVLKIAAFPIGLREYAMVAEVCYRLDALPYTRRREGEGSPVGMIGFSPREDFPAVTGDVPASRRKLAWLLGHIEQSIALATRMRRELW